MSPNNTMFDEFPEVGGESTDTGMFDEFPIISEDPVETVTPGTPPQLFEPEPRPDLPEKKRIFREYLSDWWNGRGVDLNVPGWGALQQTLNPAARSAQMTHRASARERRVFPVETYEKWLTGEMDPTESQLPLEQEELGPTIMAEQDAGAFNALKKITRDRVGSVLAPVPTEQRLARTQELFPGKTPREVAELLKQADDAYELKSLQRARTSFTGNWLERTGAAVASELMEMPQYVAKLPFNLPGAVFTVADVFAKYRYRQSPTAVETPEGVETFAREPVQKILALQAPGIDKEWLKTATPEELDAKAKEIRTSGTWKDLRPEDPLDSVVKATATSAIEALVERGAAGLLYRVLAKTPTAKAVMPFLQDKVPQWLQATLGILKDKGAKGFPAMMNSFRNITNLHSIPEEVGEELWDPLLRTLTQERYAGDERANLKETVADMGDAVRNWVINLPTTTAVVGLAGAAQTASAKGMSDLQWRREVSRISDQYRQVAKEVWGLDLPEEEVRAKIEAASENMDNPYRLASELIGYAVQHGVFSQRPGGTEETPLSLGEVPGPAASPDEWSQTPELWPTLVSRQDAMFDYYTKTQGLSPKSALSSILMLSPAEVNARFGGNAPEETEHPFETADNERLSGDREDVGLSDENAIPDHISLAGLVPEGKKRVSVSQLAKQMNREGNEKLVGEIVQRGGEYLRVVASNKDETTGQKSLLAVDQWGKVKKLTEEDLKPVQVQGVPERTVDQMWGDVRMATEIPGRDRAQTMFDLLLEDYRETNPENFEALESLHSRLEHLQEVFPEIKDAEIPTIENTAMEGVQKTQEAPEGVETQAEDVQTFLEAREGPEKVSEDQLEDADMVRVVAGVEPSIAVQAVLNSEKFNRAEEARMATLTKDGWDGKKARRIVQMERMLTLARTGEKLPEVEKKPEGEKKMPFNLAGQVDKTSGPLPGKPGAVQTKMEATAAVDVPDWERIANEKAKTRNQIQVTPEEEATITIRHEKTEFGVKTPYNLPEGDYRFKVERPKKNTIRLVPIDAEGKTIRLADTQGGSIDVITIYDKSPEKAEERFRRDFAITKIATKEGAPTSFFKPVDKNAKKIAKDTIDLMRQPGERVKKWSDRMPVSKNVVDNITSKIRRELVKAEKESGEPGAGLSPETVKSLAQDAEDITAAIATEYAAQKNTGALWLSRMMKDPAWLAQKQEAAWELRRELDKTIVGIRGKTLDELKPLIEYNKPYFRDLLGRLESAALAAATTGTGKIPTIRPDGSMTYEHGLVLKQFLGELEGWDAVQTNQFASAIKHIEKGETLTPGQLDAIQKAIETMARVQPISKEDEANWTITDPEIQQSQMDIDSGIAGEEEVPFAGRPGERRKTQFARWSPGTRATLAKIAANALVNDQPVNLALVATYGEKTAAKLDPYLREISDAGFALLDTREKAMRPTETQARKMEKETYAQEMEDVAARRKAAPPPAIPYSEQAQTRQGKTLIADIEKDKKGKYGIRRILNFLMDGLDVDFRIGKEKPAGIKGNPPAFYQRRGRIAQSVDVRTSAGFHEAGHDLYYRLQNANAEWSAPFADFLLDLTSQEKYPGTFASADNLSEGTAEFMRRMIQDPASIAHLKVAHDLAETCQKLIPDAWAVVQDTQLAYSALLDKGAMHVAMTQEGDVALNPSNEHPGFWKSVNTVLSEMGTASWALQALQRRIFTKAGGLGAKVRSSTMSAKEIENNRKLWNILKRPGTNIDTWYSALVNVACQVADVMTGQGVRVYIQNEGQFEIGPQKRALLKSAGLPIPPAGGKAGELVVLCPFSYEDIIKPMIEKGEYVQWRQYGDWVSQLARWDAKQHEYPGFDEMPPEERRRKIAELNKQHPNWYEQYKKVEQLHNALLTLSVLSGEKTVEEAVRMRGYSLVQNEETEEWSLQPLRDPETGKRTRFVDYWAQLRRPEEETEQYFRTGRIKGAGAPSTGYRPARGSQLRTVDPADALERRANAAYSAYTTNMMRRAAVEFFQTIAGDPLASPAVKETAARAWRPIRGTSTPVYRLNTADETSIKQQIAKALTEQYGEPVEADDLNIQLAGRTFWQAKRPGGPNILAYWDSQGTARYVQVLDPDFFDFMARQRDAGPVGRCFNEVITPATQQWKSGVTGRPRFILRNILLDPVTATMNAKYAEELIWGCDAVVGLWSIIMKKPVSKLQAEMLAAISRESLTAEQRTAMKGEGFIGQWLGDIRQEAVVGLTGKAKPLTVFSSLLYKPVAMMQTVLGLRRLSAFSERLSRVGAAQIEKWHGGTDLEAMDRYQQVTVPFGRTPNSPLATSIYRGAGFANPSVQAGMQLLKQFTAPDIKDRAWAMTKLTTIMGETALAFVLLKSILKALPGDWWQWWLDRQKNTPETSRFRAMDIGIRVPFQYGFIGVPQSFVWNSLINSEIEGETGFSWKNWLTKYGFWTAVDTPIQNPAAILGPIPSGIAEYVTGFSFYKMEPVEPAWMIADRPPAERFYRDTPGLYVWLGRLTGGSPLRLQNLMRGALNEMYDDSVKLYDQIKKGELGKTDKANLPFLGVFTRKPTGNFSQPVKTIRDQDGQYLELDRKLKYLEEEGGTEEQKTVARNARSTLTRAHETKKAIDRKMKDIRACEDRIDKYRQWENPPWDLIQRQRDLINQHEADMMRIATESLTRK